MNNFWKGCLAFLTMLFGGALLNGIRKKSYASGWFKGYDASKADYEEQKMKKEFEELQKQNKELLEKLKSFEA